LFFMVSALVAGLGGLAQVNPIWIYGPFVADRVSSASQPDWYMGWLEGALRIMPAWEIRAFGFEIPNPFFPGVLLPGITFMLLYAWPLLEQRFSHDGDAHNILDRPRDRPLRTALGASALSFYFLLFLAGGTDVWAVLLHASVNALVVSFRVSVLTLPPLVGLLTYRLCKELSAAHGGSRKPPAIFERSTGGGYAARPAPRPAGSPEPELAPEPLPEAAGTVE
jgi:ubiquinol-cytochrome c reductase cytochrome b subunit